jgi:hypothetical protein
MKELTKKLAELVEEELRILESFSIRNLKLYRPVEKAQGVIEIVINQMRYYGVQVDKTYDRYLSLKVKCREIYEEH